MIGNRLFSQNNRSFSFERLEEFDDHRLVLYFHEESAGLKGFIAIHRGGLVRPAFGATRLWNYPTEEEALRDVLNLSRIMSHKNAMAGANYGGAKAVIISPHLNETEKKNLLLRYSQWLNYVGGHFITGADVGISEKDLKVMAECNKSIVGFKGDVIKFTALGVFNGIQVCLDEVFGTDNLKDRTFAIQGLGKTGLALLDYLYAGAKKVYVTDIDHARIALVQEKYPNVEVVKLADIHKVEVDVFCPCALSNAINLKNISSLKCKIIVGSANSQLESNQIGELLHKLDVLYAPDYVVNAGGLITVVDEHEHSKFDEARILEKVMNIKTTLRKVIKTSKEEKKPTSTVADAMAERIFNKFV